MFDISTTVQLNKLKHFKIESKINMKLSLKRLNSRGVAHHALIAILVISGFASFGAYRVFSSSAASNDKAKSSQQDGKDKAKQTDKEKQSAKEAELAKQKEKDKKNGGNQNNSNQGQNNKDQQAKEQAEKDRQAREKAERERAAKEQAAKEAERKKKAAEEADRRQKAQEAEQKKKDDEQRKSDQQAGCTNNQILVNGKCVARKNCKSGERLTNQNTCETRVNTSQGATNGGQSGTKNSDVIKAAETGGPRCVPGFELSKDKKSCVCPTDQENIGGRCAAVSGTPEQIRAQCKAANKGYDVSKNTCTTNCTKGYELKGSTCVVRLAEDQVKAVCAAQYLKYDAKANVCKNECKPGFTKDAIGVNCLEEKTPQEVKAACDALFLKYDGQKNICGECKVNFSRTGNVCQPNENMNVVKATCAAEGKRYDKETNTCKQECKEGYVGRIADNFQEGTSTTTCTLRGGSTEEQNRAKCAAAFKKWDATNKACTETCKTGFTQQADGSCKINDQYTQLKGECDKKFLAFDNETRTCKADKCKLGYILDDNKQCIKNEEYERKMTGQRCTALGRVWIKADATDDTIGLCTSVCIEPQGQYAAQGTPDTSYCIGKNPLLSVDESMSAAECNAANRIFIYLSKVCAPRCKAGYTSAVALLGASRALDTTSTTSKDPLGCIEGTPADNGGQTAEEGGCTDGVEVDEATGLCPGDSVSGQAEPPVANVDSNVSKDLCKQLGREWESGSKDADGNKVKGCKVDECKNDEATLVTSESGLSFCKGYVVKISKDRCNEAGRIWIKEAQGCAANPKFVDLKDGKTKSGNGVCADKKDMLLAVDGTDVCVSPSRVDKLKDIARSAGLPFAQVVNLSKAGLCKVNPTKHWNGEKCVSDKPAKDLSTGTPNTNGEPEGESKAPNGQDWTAFCNSLGRSSTDNGCAQSCKDGSKIRNPDNTSYGYDRCDSKSSICKADGGTKDCSSPSGQTVQQDCSEIVSGVCRIEARKNTCDRLGDVIAGGFCNGVGEKTCKGNGLRWVVQDRTYLDNPFGPAPGKCYWT